MLRSVYKDNAFLREEEAEPECGKDFCDGCGDCLECYGCDPCIETEGDHVWVVYE